MTRFCVFSDLHAHRWPEFGAADRLNDCLTVLSDIRSFCVQESIKHVFFLGDLFHQRGVLWTEPYARVANELVAFKDAGIVFNAIHGNHDDEDKDGDVHALQPLMAGGLMVGIGSKGWRQVRVGDATVNMFAYCDSRDVLAKRIRKAGQADIGLFHHGFKGARVGSSLEYEVKEPIDAKQLRLNKRFKLVLSGHYHTHQRIVGLSRGWYVGSPLEHTRSDRCEERKGFLTVDTKTMTFERVPLKRPRFVSITVGDKLDDVQGNFVDVIYKQADESLDACLAEIKRLDARGVNPIPLPSAKQETKKRLNVSPELSPNKVLRRYVKHRKRDAKKTKIDRSELVRFGLELMTQAEGDR